MPMSTDITPLMERARLLRLKQDHIARYSGLNSTLLSRAMNLGQYVELSDYRKIERFIETAEELTRRAGAALDWKDFMAIDRLLKELTEEKLNPPSLPTPRDWELLSFVHNPSMTPVSIAEHFGITLTELSKQMTEATRRFDYSANKMSARNADIGRLSKETISFVDEQQAKRTL
jgi:hypothetical protein